MAGLNFVQVIIQNVRIQVHQAMFVATGAKVDVHKLHLHLQIQNDREERGVIKWVNRLECFRRSGKIENQSCAKNFPRVSSQLPQFVDRRKPTANRVQSLPAAGGAPLWSLYPAKPIRTAAGVRHVCLVSRERGKKKGKTTENFSVQHATIERARRTTSFLFLFNGLDRKSEKGGSCKKGWTRLTGWGGSSGGGQQVNWSTGMSCDCTWPSGHK